MFRIFEEFGIAVEDMNSAINDWCKRYSDILALLSANVDAIREMNKNHYRNE